MPDADACNLQESPVFILILLERIICISSPSMLFCFVLHESLFISLIDSQSSNQSLTVQGCANIRGWERFITQSVALPHDGLEAHDFSLKNEPHGKSPDLFASLFWRTKLPSVVLSRRRPSWWIRGTAGSKIYETFTVLICDLTERKSNQFAVCDNIITWVHKPSGFRFLTL